MNGIKETVKEVLDDRKVIKGSLLMIILVFLTFIHPVLAMAVMTFLLGYGYAKIEKDHPRRATRNVNSKA